MSYPKEYTPKGFLVVKHDEGPFTPGATPPGKPGSCWACGNICSPAGEPWTCDTCGVTYPTVSDEVWAWSAQPDGSVTPVAPQEDLEAAAEVFDALVAGTHYQRQAEAVEAMSTEADLEAVRRYIGGPS